MKTATGIYTDTSNYDVPPGFLAFAKNILLTETLGVIQNEKGVVILSRLTGKHVLGALGIHDDIVLWSLRGDLSEIGILDANGVYTEVINDNDLIPAGSALNFNINYPILAQYYFDYRGHRIVAWIDDINTPKIIDIDEPSVQVADLEMFTGADLAIPTVSVLQTGGSLLAGAYKILYRYEDADGSLSNYSVPTKPLSIIVDINTEPTDSAGGSLVWGNEGGIATSKAIAIQLIPDPDWTFVRFAVLKTINSITTTEEFAKVPTASIININYTGSETSTPLLLEELFTPTAHYINAKAIAQLNNKLYLGNLTTEEELQVQKFCLNVKLNWTSRLLSTLDGGNPSITKEKSGSSYTSFQHGEVYAVYIQFRDLKTGLWTKGFHIPGYPYDAAGWAAAGHDSIIAPNPAGPYISGTGSPTFKKYKLEDSPWVTGGGFYYGAYASPEGPGYYGNFSVWRNDNETYPNIDDYNGTVDYQGNPIAGGIDFRGQPVVHHKFPTIRWCKSLLYSGTSAYGVRDFDILGMTVTNVNLPAELAGRFASYRLLYAKRDIGDATVLGVDQLFFFGLGGATGFLKPTASNCSYQAQVDPNDYINLGAAATHSKGSEFVRYHAFNTQVDLPAVAPTYLRQELLMTYASTADINNLPDPRLIVDELDSDAYRKWVLYAPHTQSPAFPLVISDLRDRFRNVTFLQYLPTGAIVNYTSNSGVGVIDNTCGESCMLLRNNITGLPEVTTLDNMIKFLACVSNGPQQPFYRDNSDHRTQLSALCVLKSDVYTSFYSQELLATDREILAVGGNLPTNSGPIYIQGGDTFVGFNSVALQGPYSDTRNIPAALSGGDQEGSGVKSVSYFMTESAKNLNYRYQDPADLQSSFYSASDLRKILKSQRQTLFLGLLDLFQSPKYLYNPDYSVRNDAAVNLSTFNPFDISVNRFPATVIASLDAGPDTTNVAWKTFLANDRYTMPKYRGEIINLQGVANQKLYIHMENGLFITKDRTALKTTAADVTLGSGNIFDITPAEVLSIDQGYAGTHNKFGCLLTKAGYAFVDISQGKIFLHDGNKLEEISRAGLRQFWRDHIDNSIIDNPFNHNGVTLGYDETYNRLLVSIKKADGTYITASYSPQQQAWSSFHDYGPDSFISLRKNKFLGLVNYAATDECIIYTHNVGEYGLYYQDIGSPRYPMLVDVIYNKDPYTTKIFTGINWYSQVFDSSNKMIKGETIDFMTVSSPDKSTGRVEIEPYVNSSEIHNSNTRYTETSWSFNQLRNIIKSPLNSSLQLGFQENYNINPVAIDPNKDWYNKGRLIDGYLVVRFEYSNLNNNKFLLLDHDVEKRNSYR